jgi:hypothetical protein
METFYNFPVSNGYQNPLAVPVFYTVEGNIVMSDGFIVDTSGMIISELVYYNTHPFCTEQTYECQSTEQSPTPEQSPSIDKCLDFRFVIFGSRDEIVEKEEVELDLVLNLEHPGVQIAEHLLD